jgi:hypothetical protein
MEYDYIPDHSGQSGEMVPGRFWASVRLQALVRGIGAAVQLLEDQLLDLQLSGTLDGSYGAWQDAWGELVGLRRLGLSDTDYSKFIAAMGYANSQEPPSSNKIIAAALAMGANEAYTYTYATQAAGEIEMICYSDWDTARLRAARRVFEAARGYGIGPGDDEGMVIGPYGAFRLDVGPCLDDGLLGDNF